MQAYILFYEKKWVFEDSPNHAKLPKQMSYRAPSPKKSLKLKMKTAEKSQLGKRKKPTSSIESLVKKVAKKPTAPLSKRAKISPSKTYKKQSTKPSKQSKPTPKASKGKKIQLSYKERKRN